MPPYYGYLKPQKPQKIVSPYPAASPLSRPTGPSDPFGLARAAIGAQASPAPKAAAPVARQQPMGAAPTAGMVPSSALSAIMGQQPTPTAAGVNTYSLNGPAVQNADALAGLSDEQA